MLHRIRRHSDRILAAYAYPAGGRWGDVTGSPAETIEREEIMTDETIDKKQSGC